MGNAPAERRLDALALLARQLPRAGSPALAAGRAVAALTSVGVSASVASIQGDVAVILAVNVPARSETGLSPELASSLVGMRLPVDGVETLRWPVRLRQPYFGPAGATDTLRRLSTDTAFSRALPSAAAEGNSASVPVIARDRVLAVVSAWGPGCNTELIPFVEAVAAMLASAFDDRDETHAADGPQLGLTRQPNRHLRRAITELLSENSIVAAMQPIVRLYDQTVVGFEALARFPARPSLESPEQLFVTAASVNMLAPVDLACIRAAMRGAPQLGDADLFVNVLIGTLLDHGGIAALEQALHEVHVSPDMIVLEFSEREPVPDLNRLQGLAAELRARGFRIAVDDAGAGHASMRLIAELRPAFIKIDRSLIHNIDSDRARCALVVALLSFSGHIGSRLIAEGIETAAERDTLLSLGVQFGQGWLLSRPVLTGSAPLGSDVQTVDSTWFAHQPTARTQPLRLLGASKGEQALPKQQPVLHPGRSRGLAQALSDAALALQSEHDPLRILGVMAEQMSRVVPTTEMAIFVADYEKHQLVPVLATGSDAEQILADSFSLDAGLTGWAFALGTPQNITDTSAHPKARQVPGTAVVSESLLLVPLVATEHKLGIINCWRLGVNQFSKRDLEAASLFAHIAASAWRNAQLYHELLDAAMTDPLTRLYNSRWLRDTGERDLARASRDGRPVALLLVDLDHFKMVNDNAGHAVGDLLLQRVATRLRTTVRGADAVVRLGGEEFVVLLHDCDADAARTVAESVRIAVRDIVLPEDCSLPRLTASIGIASFPEHGGELNQLLAAADRAMYIAKRGGRDSVVIAAAPAGAAVVPLPLQPTG